MRAVGRDPVRIPETARNGLEVFIELHVEQGPTLEQQGLPTAVVTGFPRIHHYLVEVRRRADHAGAMPMDLRQDPMPATVEMISAVIARTREISRPAVTTGGRALVEPTCPNIVPEKVSVTIDVQHPGVARLAELCSTHEETPRTVALRHGRAASWQSTTSHPPCACDLELVRLLVEATAEQELR